MSTVAATACSEGSTEPGGAIVKLDIVQDPISQPRTNMLRGVMLQLIAVPINADSNFVNIPVTWTSSDNAKATVSTTGLVTTVAGGNVTISATAGGQTGTYDLNIQFPVGTVTVTPTGQTIRQEGTVALTATLLGTDGQPAVGRTVTWTSSNTAVATVSSTGVVQGVSNGTVTITATSEGVSGATTVTVSGSAIVTTVTVTGAGSSTFKAIGQTLQFTHTSRAASGNTVSGTTATWSGSSTVASISASGLATCLTAGSGTATATVDNGLGVNVTGSRGFICAPEALAVQPVPDISAGAAQTYAITVPAGATQLRVTLANGSGDPDLYIFAPNVTASALGASTGYSNFTDASFESGPGEAITITNPAAGTWRISIHAWSPAGNASGQTMTVTITTP